MPAPGSRPKGTAAWSATLITVALIGAVVWHLGPQAALSPVCTDWMYAEGWTCFLLWAVLAVASAPWRATGCNAAWVALHGVLFSVAWVWWTVAVALAGLHARADMLWLTYVTAGGTIIFWRTFGHRMVLRGFIRQSFARSDCPAGALRFAGVPAELADPIHGGWADRALGAAAWLHERAVFRSVHRWWYGETGRSDLVVAEAMRHTDERAAVVSAGLHDEETLGPNEGVRRDAERLMTAFRAECAVWACLAGHFLRDEAEDGGDAPTGLGIRTRALAVFTLVSACVTRRAISDIEGFIPAILRLEGSAVGADWCKSLKECADALKSRNHRALATLLSKHALHLIERPDGFAESSPDPETTLLVLARASALLHYGLHRPGRAMLGSLERAGIPTPWFRLLLRDSFMASIADGPPGSDATTTLGLPDKDTGDIAKSRAGAKTSAAMAWQEAFPEGQVVPSDFGKIPSLTRPREVGVGLAVALVGGIFAMWLWIPWRSPFSDRLQPLVDVPFGGEVASEGVSAATVAGGAADRAILLATQEPGVKVIDLASLRARHEGGAETALDGKVTNLATSPDGSAFAIFDHASNGSACISARSPDGEWVPVIAPAEVAIDGEGIQAFLPGLREPLILTRDGEQRLLRYADERRCLRAIALEGETKIDGNFVDCSEMPGQLAGGTALLLTHTDIPEADHLYDLQQSQAGGPLRVRRIDLPNSGPHRAIAISATRAGGALLVDSGGASWLKASVEDDAPWTPVRAGDQGASLDGVDVVALLGELPSLWMVRGSEVWTRDLPSGEDPAASLGWRKGILPVQATKDVGPQRFLVRGSGPSSNVTVLAPADGSTSATGAMIAITAASASTTPAHTPEPLSCQTLLGAGERLVDADAFGDQALAVVTLPPQAGRPWPTMRLEAVLPARTTIRETPLPTDLPPAARLDGVLDATPAAGSALVLTESGDCLRLDTRRDALLPIVEGQQVLHRHIPLVEPPVDVAIDPNPLTPSVVQLTKGGSIQRFPLSSGNPSPTTLVEVKGTPPNSVLDNLHSAISTPDGATLFSPQQAWQFTAGSPAQHFQDLTSQLGTRPAQMVATTDAGGHPAIAWLAKDGSEFRSFSEQSFSTTQLKDPAASLLPALGNSCFAINRSQDLWSLPIGGQPVCIIRSPGRGPDQVLGASIRDGFVDYLGTDRVYSVRRDDGTWTESEPLGGSFVMRAADEGGELSTVLLPETPGIPHVLAPGAAASKLKKLDKLGAIVPVGQMRGGVLARSTSGTMIGWLPLSGEDPTKVESVAVQGLNMRAVTEAVVIDEGIALLGTDAGSAQTLVARTALSNGGTPSFARPQLRAMEPSGSWLYVLGESELFALDPTTLRLQETWSIGADQNQVLGHSSGPPPAVGGPEGIVIPLQGRLDRPLRSPSPVAPLVPDIVRAAAWGNHIALFTEDGAWIRGSSSDRPFTRFPQVSGRVDAIILASGQADPWVRQVGEWVNLGSGARIGASIGWTPHGKPVAVSADGALLVGGAPVDGLSSARERIGPLVGVESLDGSVVLLVGESRSALYDLSSLQFPPTHSLLAQLPGTTRFIECPGRPRLAIPPSGLIVEASALHPRVLFGNRAIETVLPAGQLYAQARDGDLVDAAGVTLQGMPPKQPGTAVRVRSAAALGTDIYRVLGDRTLDRIDTRTLECSRIADTADAVAAVGGRVYALNRGDSVVSSPGSQDRWQSEGWFIGHDAIASWTPGSVTVLAGAKLERSTGFAAPIPGTPVSSLAGTTVLLTRNTQGVHSLYDAYSGKVILAQVPGSAPSVVGSAILSLSTTGKQAISTDSSGRVRYSPQYFDLLHRAGQREALAIKESRQSLHLLAINGETLEESAPLRVWGPAYPKFKASRSNPVSIASISPEAVLLITPQTLGLAVAGRQDPRLQLSDNPIGATVESLSFEWPRVLANRPDGSRCVLVQWTDEGWGFPAHDEASAGPIYGPPHPRDHDIKVSPAGSTVQLPEGPFETATGWLLSDKPIRLVDDSGVPAVLFADGHQLPLARSADSQSQGVSAPLSVGQGDGVLRFSPRPGTSVVLGQARQGEILPCHRPVAAAAMGSAGDFVWIDQLGQLWNWAGGKIDCTDPGLNLNNFALASEGALIAQSGDKGFAVGDRMPGGGRCRAVQPQTLYEDATKMPGSCGPFEWHTAPSRDVLWALTCNPQVHIDPTTAGFRQLTGATLASHDGKPVAKAAACIAPILERSIRWDLAMKPEGAQPPASPARAGLAVTVQGDRSINIGPMGSAVHVLGAEFKYLPEASSFQCNRCVSATCIDGAIMALTPNREIIAWPVGASGAVGEPKRLPPPPGSPATALWPGSEGLIADSSSESGTVHHRWDGRAWRPHEIPRFTAFPDAKWDWDGTRFRIDSQWYALLPNAWPALDADIVDTQAGAARSAISTDEFGVISFLSPSGRWFQLRRDRMPAACSSPPAPPSAYELGGLSLDRWPIEGASLPRCVLSGPGGALPVRLSLEHGLMRDLEGWDRATPVVRTSPDEAVVPMRVPGIFRVLKVQGGGLRILPPTTLDPPTPYQCCPPQLQDGPISLDEQLGLHCGNVDLGVPGPKGFGELQPSLIVPLSITPSGAFTFANDRGIFTATPGSLLNSLTQTSDLADIRSAAWRSESGNLAYYLQVGDGKEHRMARPAAPPGPPRDAPPPLPVLAQGGGGEGVFDVVRTPDGSLTLQRQGATPTTLRIVPGGGGHASLAHWSATSIEPEAAGFRTVGDQWTAHYQPEGAGWQLTAVGPAAASDRPPSVRPLGGGLHAHRSGNDARWTIRVGASPDAALWPIGAYLGADRHFVLDSKTVLECGADWWRQSALNGEVVARGRNDSLLPATSQDAYRNGNFICAQGSALELTGNPAAIVRDKEAVLPPLGSFSGKAGERWTVSLPHSGGALELACDGIALKAADGALPMDYAIAAAVGGGDGWLVDRHGISSQGHAAGHWARHEPQRLAQLLDAAPARATGRLGADRIDRVYVSAEPGGLVAHGLPRAEVPALSSETPVGALSSWAGGSRLGARVGADGAITLQRPSGVRGEWHIFPPLRPEEACRKGRLAFDLPIGLVLAELAPGTPPVACMQTPVSWESLPSATPADGHWPELRRDAPPIVEPEFGPKPRSEWLAGTDVSIEGLAALRSRAGIPIVWCPEGERLFLVGEKAVGWVELSPRWTGRPIQ